MSQYLFEMIVESSPLQNVVSEVYVVKSLYLIFIKYAVMRLPLSLGNVQVILIVVSVFSEIVTIASLSGTDAAKIPVTEE